MNFKFNQLKERDRRAEGFSLIELIGVLTIIAVLAAAAGPTFIKRIDYAAKTAEKEVLRSLTNALVTGCLANTAIPAAASMPATIAQVLNCNVAQVTVNARGFGRLIIVDPSISIGGAQTNLQTSAGISTPPSNARVVILSTIAKGLPTIAPDAAEFEQMWTIPADSVPTVLSSWGGRGEDLLIERVNFGPLFYKLVLSNVDPLPATKPNLGHYSIQSDNTNYVNPSGTFSAYYYEGTLLTLFKADGVTKDTRQILYSDISFLYQNHKWSRRLQGSDESVGTFGELASEFIKPPAPSDPKFAATQQAVINQLYSFLWTYDNWAYGDTNATPIIPPYQRGSAVANYPSYSLVSESQVHLDEFTGNLIQ
jgi:prepilin-type N-terminal cleavage/methylation domain-containing protein